MFQTGEQKTIIGTIGQYHPLVLEQLKIETNAQVVGTELYLERLEELVKGQEHNFEMTAGYQTIQDQILLRDVSFVIPKSMLF